MAQARKPGAKISQVYRHFFYVKGGMDGKQRKKLLTLVEVCCVALLAPPIVCLFLVPCASSLCRSLLPAGSSEDPAKRSDRRGFIIIIIIPAIINDGLGL